MLQILFLLIYQFYDSLQSCDTIHLYEDFISGTRTEIPVCTDPSLSSADNKFLCLSMYDKVVPYEITEDAMENICRDTDTKRYIVQAADTPSVIIGEVNDEILDSYSCLPSYYVNFIKELKNSIDRQPNTNEEEKTLRLTCPLGLLYDMSCNYMSCFNSDKCSINGKMCPDEEAVSTCSNSSLTLHPYCKDDLMNFVRSCTSDLKFIENIKKLPELRNTNCQRFNMIYQGLTSFEVLKQSTIAAHCVRGDENVTLKCFKNGIPLNNVTWRWLADGEEVSLHHDNMTYPRDDLNTIEQFVCEEAGEVVAEMTGKDLHKLCKKVNNEHYVDDAEDPTLVSTTSSTPASRSPWNKRTFFYKADIWLLKSITNVVQLNMLNNNVTLRELVGNLFIAMVSVMGQKTPVCGDGWDEAAGKVFCKDAGRQLGEEWTAAFVGAVPKTSDGRHYLRNLKCSGTEEKLIWCNHTGWFHHESCEHDAVILCSKTETVTGVVVNWQLILIVAAAVVVLVVVVGYCYSKYPVQLQRLKQSLSNHILRQRRVSDANTVTTLINTYGFNQLPSRGTSPTGMDLSESMSFPMGTTSIPVTVLPMPKIKEEGVIKIDHSFLIKGKPPDEIPKVARVIIDGKKYMAKRGEQKYGESESDLKSEFMFLKTYTINHKCHPNIVKLHDSELKSIGSKMYFIMEYLDYGSLDSFLRMKKEETTPSKFSNLGHTLTPSEISRLIVGVCRALYFVHKHGYVHGDLKSDNYFVYKRPDDSDSSDRFDVKLGDFEYFYKFEPSVISSSSTGCCTFLYNAPEYCVPDSYTPVDPQGRQVIKDPYKNEVWSLGYIIWELISFIGCTHHEDHDVGPLASTSGKVQLKSRFTDLGISMDNFTCNRRKHIPLLENFDRREIPGANNMQEPDKKLMFLYWKEYDKDPTSVSYPEMSPRIDEIMGWEVCGLVKKCLSVFPDNRPTMADIMKCLTERFDTALLKSDCPDRDLFKNFNHEITCDLFPDDHDDPMLHIEDTSSLDSYSELLTGSTPEELQRNLGQLA